MAYKRLTEEQKTFNKMYRETKKVFEGKDWWDVVLEDEAKAAKLTKKKAPVKKVTKTEQKKKTQSPQHNPFAILETIQE